MARSIFRKIIFVIYLLFFSTHVNANTNISVKITNIIGIVKVKKTIDREWEKAEIGQNLHNNDIIKVEDNSKATLIWNDDTKLYVNSDSRVLINIYQNKQKRILSKHITLFSGEIFLLIKKVITDNLYSKISNKIYTPTAVCTVRGTAFSVKVKKDDKSTVIKVINGTVLVQNINKNQTNFLSAGYISEIIKDKNPMPPKPLLQKDIDLLKKWVPNNLVSVEMKKQLKQARKDNYAITGKLEEKLLIIPFTNKSDYSGSWKIEENIPTILSSNIKKTINNLKILNNMTIRNDPIKAGGATKSKYVLVGEITAFDLQQRAEISVAADDYKEYVMAKVGLKIKLIDIANEKVILNINSVGEVSGDNIPQNNWDKVNKINFDINNKAFTQTIIYQALMQSLDNITNKIAKLLGQKQ